MADPTVPVPYEATIRALNDTSPLRYACAAVACIASALHTAGVPGSCALLPTLAATLAEHSWETHAGSAHAAMSSGEDAAEGAVAGHDPRTRGVHDGLVQVPVVTGREDVWGSEGVGLR